METFQYKNLTGAATTVLEPAACTLGMVTINKASAQVITIYDGVDTTGTVIATLPASAAVGTYHYHVSCNRGLTVVTAASYAGDVTISYK